MFVPKTNHGRPTRQTEAGHVIVPHLLTPVGRKVFSYHGSSNWNKIDNTIKGSETFNTFESEMMKPILRDVNHSG